MAKKCSICGIRAAKRYCQSIDNVLCPVCCAKSRMKTIDCAETCKYLEGVEYQKAKDEKTRFANLMKSVPHGQFDDIFKDFNVAKVAADIELFIKDIYVSDKLPINDYDIFNAYKQIYQIHENEISADMPSLSPLTRTLFSLYSKKIANWRELISDKIIGQLFLRLMLSVKRISGGVFGDCGYLNYLKNNLSPEAPINGFFMEDKDGNIFFKEL